MAEDAAVGSSVEMFKASDGDRGAGGFVTYFIDSIVSGIMPYFLT